MCSYIERNPSNLLDSKFLGNKQAFINKLGKILE